MDNLKLPAQVGFVYVIYMAFNSIKQAKFTLLITESTRGRRQFIINEKI